MELIVAKFGGTSVGNGERIKKAAQSVVNEYKKGNQMVVVVSAVNKTTDDLISLTNDAIPNNLTDKQHAEIVAMGERTSSRVFAATLESLGVKSCFIDPFSDMWPIITDSNYLEAEIDFDKTIERAKELKKLLDDGIVPVVCGFIARSRECELTTLGRGGSDITAFLLGECLEADEVIIVTDVDGVLTTDPRKIGEAQLLDKITVEEMKILATQGAQVLHPHALKYKSPEIDAKIINFKYGDLTSNGTYITGPTQDEDLIIHPEPVTPLTVVGKGLVEKVGLLSDLSVLLTENNINIYKITTHHNSVTLFIDKKESLTGYRVLHDYVLKSDYLSSLSLEDDIAMISVIKPEIVQSPGFESKVGLLLKKNNIHLMQVTSSKTATILYVSWQDKKRTCKLIHKLIN